MRLKAKYIANDPEAGTVRVRREFAWSSKTIAGERIWLEFYEVLEVWVMSVYDAKVDGKAIKITAGRWVDTETRLISK